MRHANMIPIGMGVMMGTMALIMLHDIFTGDGGASGVLFILAHILVIGLAALAVVFGVHRRWPMLARILVHRPSWRHVGLMLAAACVTAGMIHLVHGAPAWT